MNSSEQSLKVDERVYRRFEEARQRTENEHVPPMDESTFLASLLDTQKAVRNGHYDEEPSEIELNGVVQDSVDPDVVKSGRFAAEDHDE